MSELDNILPVGDGRNREAKEGEYHIDSVMNGRIVCYVKGLKLGDFYKSHTGDVLVAIANAKKEARNATP